MSILVVLLQEFFPEVEMKYWFFVFLLLFFWGNVHGYLHHNEQLHLFQNKTDL